MRLYYAFTSELAVRHKSTTPHTILGWCNYALTGISSFSSWVKSSRTGQYSMTSSIRINGRGNHHLKSWIYGAGGGIKSITGHIISAGLDIMSSFINSQELISFKSWINSDLKRVIMYYFREDEIIDLSLSPYEYSNYIRLRYMKNHLTGKYEKTLFIKDSVGIARYGQYIKEIKNDLIYDDITAFHLVEKMLREYSGIRFYASFRHDKRSNGLLVGDLIKITINGEERYGIITKIVQTKNDFSYIVLLSRDDL